MCSDVLRAGVRYTRVPRPGDNAGPRPAGTRRTLYVYLLSVRSSLGKFGGEVRGGQVLPAFVSLLLVLIL